VARLTLGVIRLDDDIIEYFTGEGGGITLGDIQIVADDPAAYRALARAASMAAIQMDARRVGMPEVGQRFEFGGKHGVVERVEGGLVHCLMDDHSDMAFGAEAFTHCKREQAVMEL